MFFYFMFQLTSIKALTLYVATKSHLDIETLCLAQIIPNVQVIFLQHVSLRCTECKYRFKVKNLHLVDQSATSKAFKCMKEAWRPLWQCPKLKMITANVTPMPDKKKDFYRDEL